MNQLDGDRLRSIYVNQVRRGCFLKWEEWEDKVRKAYAELVKVANEEGLITYGELGMSKLHISEEWLLPKIPWIVGACSHYELEEGRPLLSCLAVNAETQRPGKGFWGFRNMPCHLLAESWEDRHRHPPAFVEDEREAFWINEVKETYKCWRKHEC